MSHSHLRPGEQQPTYTQLADGRWRLVRARGLNHGSEIVPGMIPAKGTPDTGPVTGPLGQWAGLRLIEGHTEPGNPHPILVLTYEQIHERDETPAGSPQVNRTEDGRIEVTMQWLQFSTGRATPQKVGVSVCTVWPITLAAVVGNAATNTLSVTGDYASGLRDGDAVQLPTLVGGLGLFALTTYYARDVSADTKTWKLAATVGGTAIDFTTNITAATLLQQVTFVLAEEQAPDDGTLRRITRRYVNRGVIAIRDVVLPNGRKEVSWTSVLVREDPPGVLVGDVDVQRPYGVPVYTVRALQALDGGELLGPVAVQHGVERAFEYPGRCAFSLREKDFGLGSVYYLGLHQSPPIQVALDTAMLTVRYSARNSLAPITGVTGTAATNRINIAAHKIPAAWPVRLTEKTGAAGLTLYTVYYVINPTSNDFQLALTVGGAAVALTDDMTDAVLSLLEHDRWNPSEWAVLDAYYLVSEDIINGAREKLEGLRGYRVAGEVVEVEFSSEVDAPLVAFGTYIATGFNGVAKLFGGPPNPGNVTWTLFAQPEVDFIGTDGTTYYRHTIITAYVPAQEALPITEPGPIVPPP